MLSLPPTSTPDSVPIVMLSLPPTSTPDSVPIAMLLLPTTSSPAPSPKCKFSAKDVPEIDIMEDIIAALTTLDFLPPLFAFSETATKLPVFLLQTLLKI